MSDFVYKDHLPLNARIIVNYNQKKGEKVKFSYPVEMTYEKAVWHNAYPTIFSFYIVILFYVGISCAFFSFLVSLTKLPSFLTNFFIIKTETITTTSSTYTGVIETIQILIFILLVLVAIPILLTFFLSRDKERLSKWVPWFGYWLGRLAGAMKEIEFTPEKIQDNRAIIPIFQNMSLKWVPDGDFDTYLEKIEIMEIPFEFKKKLFLVFGKWKKTKNEYLFRAVFHFSQKPEKGMMKVEFI
jgi:hypothetical protein